MTSPMVTDSDRTDEGEDLMMWVTAEPLGWVLETHVRLYINDTSLKSKLKISTGDNIAQCWGISGRI